MDTNSNSKSGSDEQIMDFLLVFDKEKKTINAVKGIDENGELQTVPPKQEHNNDFLKVDKQGNALEKFLRNFFNQLKDPTRFSFFKVASEDTERTVKIIQENIKNLRPAADEMLDKIRIDHKDKALNPYRVKFDSKIRIEVEFTGKYQPLDLNKLNWKEVEKLGLSGEILQDALKAMVYGHKSPGLVDIKPSVEGQEFPMQARLSLEQQPDGSIKIVTHPKQEQPDFEKPFMGIIFTPQDKEQFQKTRLIFSIA